MATAAKVRSGTADLAFGIEAAARAHDLDFIPVADEHYYVAAAATRPSGEALNALARAADTVQFRRVLSRIGGYDVARAPSRAPLARILTDPQARSGRRSART